MDAISLVMKILLHFSCFTFFCLSLQMVRCTVSSKTVAVTIICYVSLKLCHGFQIEPFNSTSQQESRFIVVKNHLKDFSRQRKSPLLFQETNLVEKLSHFVRERVIDRKTFSTGSGAFGYFECTKPNAHFFSKASLFGKVGKKTRIVARLSAGPDRNGSPQTVYNDIHGFSVRFYTDEGNWDLITMSLPVSTFRSPQRAPEATHTFDENPLNNLLDANRHIDYLTSNHEGLHSMTWQYSDIGIPKNWRVMSAFSVCTLSLINDQGRIHFVRFILKSKQKYGYMSTETARYLRAAIPDFLTRDLYASIRRGDYPEWILIAQTLTPEESKKLDFDPFDPTKVRITLQNQTS